MKIINSVILLIISMVFIGNIWASSPEEVSTGVIPLEDRTAPETALENTNFEVWAYLNALDISPVFIIEVAVIKGPHTTVLSYYSNTPDVYINDFEVILRASAYI